jgi:hypothetical protein
MSKKTLRDQTSRWIFDAVRLPGILEADETAARLGVPVHTIPILITARHIKPLGKPSGKSSKKFSSAYVDDLARDQKWLDKAIRLIDAYWANQNQKKKKLIAPEIAEAA